MPNMLLVVIADPAAPYPAHLSPMPQNLRMVVTDDLAQFLLQTTKLKTPSLRNLGKEGVGGKSAIIGLLALLRLASEGSDQVTARRGQQADETKQLQRACRFGQLFRLLFFCFRHGS